MLITDAPVTSEVLGIALQAGLGNTASVWQCGFLLYGLNVLDVSKFTMALHMWLMECSPSVHMCSSVDMPATVLLDSCLEVNTGSSYYSHT